MQLNGVYTAMVTPFLENGELDERGFLKNIDFQVSSGVAGLLILGTTGEVPTLNGEEKERLIRLCCKATKVPVVVGVGSYSTADTVKNALVAERHGAHALLVVTPYYNRPSQEGIYQHFKYLSAHTHLPIILYTHPGRCGVNIEVSTLERIFALPRVIGIKEASGNISQITSTFALTDRQFPKHYVLSGDDALIPSFMGLGSTGVFSVISNLIPKEMVNLVNLFNTSPSEALREFYRLYPLIQASTIDSNPMPVKEAMNLRGLPAGPCRLPMTSLSQDKHAKLQYILEETLMSKIHV